jgi:hypothetical protein
VAVIEALSVQRPVLVTDTSGLRELAQQGLCRSIPLSATADMISDAITAELAKVHQSSMVALSNWDDCTEQLLGIYRTVLSRKSDLPMGQTVFS